MKSPRYRLCDFRVYSTGTRMPRGIGFSSTSTQWGSAGAQITSYGDRRFHIDAASVPETKFTLHIENRNELLTGSRNVVCSTEAEYKANKLNRSEQAKLESIQMRVMKEKETFRRRFGQIENAFRAKSAKLINRSRSVDNRMNRPSSLHNNWKPGGTGDGLPKPATAIRTGPTKCELCEKIQEVIQSYELEGHRSSLLEPLNQDDHSTCMFSDNQVRAFLDVLEVEYLNDTPHLRAKLENIGISGQPDGQKRSLEEMDHSRNTQDINARIRRFCADMDKYNKENVSVPAEVRDKMEKLRLAGAIAKTKSTRELSSRSRMKKEVREQLQT